MANKGIYVNSHVGEVKAELAYRIPVILEALGAEAEGNAIDEISRMKAVDTGRLRNSITHAVSGKAPAKTSYSDDNGNSYSYSGTAPEAPKGEEAVYIGTNVEYAPYIELGTYKMAARPFLQNAIKNYGSDYKRILEEGLK